MPYRAMDSQEAADFLHVDVSELEHLVRKHDVPHDMQNGRPVFRKQDLHDWASRRILGADEAELHAYHTQVTSKQPAPDRHEAFLSQFILPESVDIDMHANTRGSLLRKLVALAAQTAMVTDDALLLRLLGEREELCPTGIAGGIAVPHTRVHPDYLFIDTFMVIAFVPSGIPFGAADGGYSDLFFMPCSQDDRTHVYMLTRLARLLQATDLSDKLRHCVDAEDVVSTFHVVESEFVEKHVPLG